MPIADDFQYIRSRLDEIGNVKPVAPKDPEWQSYLPVFNLMDNAEADTAEWQNYLASLNYFPF